MSLPKSLIVSRTNLNKIVIVGVYKLGDLTDAVPETCRSVTLDG